MLWTVPHMEFWIQISLHSEATFVFVWSNITLYNRALLQTLTLFQLVKKLLIFYGTQKFINVFTKIPLVHVLSLINSIHTDLSGLSISLSYIYTQTFQVVSSFQIVRQKFYMHFSFHLCVLHAPPDSSFLTWSTWQCLVKSTNSMIFSLCCFLEPSITSCSLDPSIPLSTLFSNILVLFLLEIRCTFVYGDILFRIRAFQMGDIRQDFHVLRKTRW